MLVKFNWLKLWWRFFGFFSLKSKKGCPLSSFYLPCHMEYGTWVAWEAWPHSHTSFLPCLLNLPIKPCLTKGRNHFCRAKNFPCYCACKTSGLMGLLSECHQNKNTPGFPRCETLDPVEGLPVAEEVGTGMGWESSQQGSPAGAYVMENGTGPCRAELECGNCSACGGLQLV